MTHSFERHGVAAQGYLELGMFSDANSELDKIDAGLRHLPEVLALRVPIYRGLEKWQMMQVAARTLALDEPDNVQWAVSLAYATRRAESIEAANFILLEAVERMPKAAVLHYLLACYECQFGDRELARAKLQHAFKLRPSLRLKALLDSDLQPLWKSLGRTIK